MKRCPTCGHRIETESDKLKGHVFTWTFMTILLWGMMLGLAEWTTEWWRVRTQLVLMFAVVPAVAAYFWVRLLQERRREAGR